MHPKAAIGQHQLLHRRPCPTPFLQRLPAIVSLTPLAGQAHHDLLEIANGRVGVGSTIVDHLA